MSSAAFKSLLATAFGRRHGTRMSNRDDKLTREERLAAKLRENLHRRKAQARELAHDQRGQGGSPDDSRIDSAALSKPASES